MEDFYKLLNIKSTAGNYSIALAYKKQIQKLIRSSSNDDSLIKIHRAYFILSHDYGKKVYDQLYGSEISGRGIKLSDRPINRYNEIINELLLEADKKLTPYIENFNQLKNSDLASPLIMLFLLKGLFYSNEGFSTITLSGFGGIMYSILGIATFIKFFQNHENNYLAAAIFISLMGLTIVTANFRAFIIEHLRKAL